MCTSWTKLDAYCHKGASCIHENMSNKWFHSQRTYSTAPALEKSHSTVLRTYWDCYGPSPFIMFSSIVCCLLNIRICNYAHKLKWYKLIHEKCWCILHVYLWFHKRMYVEFQTTISVHRVLLSLFMSASPARSCVYCQCWLRVTVVFYVCLSHLTSGASEDTVLYLAGNRGENLCSFLWNLLLQRSSTPSIERLYVQKRACIL